MDASSNNMESNKPTKKKKMMVEKNVKRVNKLFFSKGQKAYDETSSEEELIEVY